MLNCAGYILNFLSTRELMLQKHNINCSPFSLHIGYSLDITPLTSSLLHPALDMVHTQTSNQLLKYFSGPSQIFSHCALNTASLVSHPNCMVSNCQKFYFVTFYNLKCHPTLFIPSLINTFKATPP